MKDKRFIELSPSEAVAIFNAMTTDEMKDDATDHIQEFIDRVDRLDKRYKKGEYKYVDMYMMPRTLVQAVRDELKAPRLPMMRGKRERKNNNG